MHELPEKISKEYCYEIFEQFWDLWLTRPRRGFTMILTTDLQRCNFLGNAPTLRKARQQNMQGFAGHARTDKDTLGVGLSHLPCEIFRANFSLRPEIIAKLILQTLFHLASNHSSDPGHGGTMHSGKTCKKGGRHAPMSSTRPPIQIRCKP